MNPADYIFIEPRFGDKPGVPVRLPSDFGDIHALAIGPDSEFDSAIVISGGREIPVTRDAPFVGVFRTGKTIMAVPRDATQWAAGDGVTASLGLQFWNYRPKHVPPYRAPLVKHDHQGAITTSVTADLCHTFVRGRDHVIVHLCNTTVGTSCTWKLMAERFDKKTETFEELEVTPAGFGSLDSSSDIACETVMVPNAYDRLFVRIPTGSVGEGGAHVYVTMRAYDR